jgi:PEP-CTERM motif
MKHLLILLLLFATAVISRADNLVSVTTEPTVYSVFGPGGCCVNETIGVTFAWDVTTNVLSNFVVTQTGPFPTFTEANVSFGPSFINFLSFSDGQGDSFAVFREAPGRNNIGSAPGTYENIDLNLFCPGRCPEGDNFNIGTAVVTSLGDGDHDSDDPVSTPEPGTFALLGVGLVGLLARKTKQICDLC